MQKWTFRMLSVGFISVLTVIAVIAQDACAALVEEALNAVDDNCEALDRNSACYGYNLVEAAFLEDVADDFFTTPADIAAIADIQTIATTALDESAETWGVAVLNVQANVPNTIPGQNVTFVLMGDTQVENAVAPDAAFQPSDGIEVAINAAQGGNVRSGPGLNFNVIGVVANNTLVSADAQSADGAWFRIAYQERIAWVNEVVLADTTPLADLPMITPELRTSMQSFYLRTGIGATACAEAPDDILLIQGPENVEIELTINGANVRLGSTIGVRTPMIDDEPVLEVITFDGNVFVEGVRVPPTYHTLLCLKEADNLGLDGEANDFEVDCEPSTPTPVSGFGEDWCNLESIPANILNYEIEILCPGEAPPVVPTSQSAQPATPNPVETEEPTQPAAPQNNSQIAEVDCSTFQLIGPFSGISPRPTLFTWTPAPGATDYQIVFYNVSDGVEAGTFWTSETSIGVHVSEVPTGGTLAWEVRAFRNGAYACVTARTPPIIKSADPEEGNNSDGLSVSKSCTYDEEENLFANISWSNLGANDVIYIAAFPDDLPPAFHSSTEPNGTVSIQGYTPGIKAITVATESGQNIPLGDCP